MLVNIVKWRVPKEHSEKHFEFLRWLTDYQRSIPDKFHFTRSRFYTMTEEGSSEERWMFLDEYEQRDDFDKQISAESGGTELAKFVKDEVHPKWDALIVPGSRKKGEQWTEVEKLRVEFKKP